MCYLKWSLQIMSNTSYQINVGSTKVQYLPPK